MSTKKLSSSEAINNYLDDECILSSTLNNTDRENSAITSFMGNVFFLAACLTFTLFIQTSNTQASLIYDEVQQVGRNVVHKIINSNIK